MFETFIDRVLLEASLSTADVAQVTDMRTVLNGHDSKTWDDHRVVRLYISKIFDGLKKANINMPPNHVVRLIQNRKIIDQVNKTVTFEVKSQRDLEKALGLMADKFVQMVINGH